MSGRLVFSMARLGRDRLSERIVLVDQIDLLDVRNGLHVVGERFHLDVGIGVPAEMPEAALLVGQDRIDRGIVEIQDFLAGIAFVVLGDEVRQRAGHRRAVALRDVADAGVDRLLRLDQAFLRIGLVVERNDLDLLAEHAALGVQFVGQVLEGLQSALADAGAAARQRVDIAQLHRVFGDRRGAENRQARRQLS